ncbi:2-oxoglutarate dehydrogenase E2 component (dihydrolipoamide succinyltransferase) [Blastomyces silverae]|uniref:Dihydrolipoamide acetyltransferase component of pyruvate dehydrogenase complex n=1 Tax=Blastomyces silverae TaxID=2060906 RepID=A0A0H1B2R2_9EURO|nr:2-oxoglutarate dehydrogenase E2 component (dihydrolipoamide succinyltransferase) [Blastomyces silverae]
MAPRLQLPRQMSKNVLLVSRNACTGSIPCRAASSLSRVSQSNGCLRTTTQTTVLSSHVPLRQTIALSKTPLFMGTQRRTYADSIVKVPQMAESISEGTLKQFSKKIGEYVQRDEELATIETDKIDITVTAPEAGTIKEFLANEEDTVTVGQDLVKLETGGAAPEKPKEAKSEAKSEAAPPPPPSPPKQEGKTAPPPPKPEPTAQKPSPSKTEPAQAAQSKNEPHAPTDRGAPEAVPKYRGIAHYLQRGRHKTGVKLGFMSAFSRACVLAMRDIPTVNASIEGPNGGDTIVYRDYVDISVAVATEKGLVTPVVRNAESMELIGIEKAIADLGKKARDNKLTIEDMAGGTFTISNGGVFGSLLGTPIINLPQTAVLGLHAIKDKPVVVNGKIEIRPMMYLALTYDHRLLDGREAVTFLVKIKEYIEDPRRMLLA